MSFLQHIEELRKRIILALVCVALCCGIVAFFATEIMNGVLLLPAINAGISLQNLAPFGQPFLYFKTILISGLLLSSPFILLQFWLFISPALYENERKWVVLGTIFATLCFLLGVIFSYFVMIPSMLGFAASFGSELIENKIDINAYFGFISLILLATGCIFELPILSFILTKIGLITHKTLGKYRRHAIVVILILAAVITPTPDPISQLILAIPIYILYEISIFIAFIVEKKKKITEDN